jgi:hypothetical protein
VVSRVADGGRQMADHLAKHGPDGVLAEVQDFARRRPGAFLAVAVTSGFVVGRLARGTLAATSDAGTSDQASPSAAPSGSTPPAPYRDPSTMDTVVLGRPDQQQSGAWAEGGGA